MPLTNLKPAFYRVAGTQAVQSGWINEATGDICDTEDGDHMRVRVIPGAKPAFTIGQRLEFVAAVDLYPYDVVTIGERAHVASIDLQSGEACLLLEGIHDGLEDNMMVLTPFNDEEVLASVRDFEEVVKASHSAPRPSLWWAAAIFGAVVPLVVVLAAILPSTSVTMILGCVVVLTAIALGSLHALTLALLFPLTRNLLIIPPELEFSAPTADEYIRAATWVALALLVPWLCKNRGRIREVLVRWESELTEGQTVHRR
jgi:hypothetical protein